MLRREEFNKFPEKIKTEPVEVRLAKAKDLRSSPGLLEVLSRDRFWYVRDFVAANPNTPKRCLDVLKNDCDSRVRSEANKSLEKLNLKNNCVQEGLEHKISFAKNINVSNSYTIRAHTYNTRQ